MTNLSLRTRVLLLALVPMVVIAGYLSLHFSFNRLRELDNALHDRGLVIARQLAPACEYGVFAGNREILDRLAQAAVAEADVKMVTITDAKDEVLASRENLALAARSVGHDSGLRFRLPIERSVLHVDDFADARGEPQGARPAGPIGWVTVELSSVSTVERQRAVLFESLLIVLVALAVTGIIAWRLGRGITKPVKRLTSVVERIRAGDLEQRVPAQSGGELGLLEAGVNAMAEGLSHARAREQRQAEDALFQEQVRAQVTLESIGDGVITTNADGAIVYMNPVAADLTGWRVPEAEGRHLSAVFRVLDERVTLERDYPLFVCLQEGRVMRHENRHSLLRKDGRRFSIQDSAAPIRDRDGRILGAVVVFHDITEMQHLANRMAFLATHDSLTGLLNRHEFEVRLQQALETARSEGRRHAVCYLDLDQFKIVNDTCGHVAGDELLKQLTHQLHSRIREADVLARLGGDEFGVIIHDCDMDAAYRFADTLRLVVKDFRFVWGDRSFDIGVSVGMVPISDISGSMTDVLSAADSACYVAKDHGRNRVHIYQPNDDALAQRHGEMQWVQRIKDGLEAGRFLLFGQRILSLNGGGPEFCEILLRLEEPGKTLVPPSAFIPAAERYYLMPTIDRWVVQQSLTLLGQHTKFPEVARQRYAINLSGQSLCDEQFADFVVEHLRQSGVPPASICFEITETAAVANLVRATEFIGRLKDMGCHFALDDFGSGLSSFSYLKNLPVDYLKIAGNFIQDINMDPVDFAMVDAINQIGHVMGLQTIAESVEDETVLARLRALGVDYAQGYGLHEPVLLAHLPESSLRVALP